MSEFDPRVTWNALEGNVQQFAASVRWQPIDEYPIDHPAYALGEFPRLTDEGMSDMRDIIKERVEEWLRHILTGGLERRPGQMRQILEDLGPCPPNSQPDSVCMWLGALVNPLPALGVAPEVRKDPYRVRLITLRRPAQTVRSAALT